MLGGKPRKLFISGFFLIFWKSFQLRMDTVCHSTTACMVAYVTNLQKWWATDTTFEELRILCDGERTHAKWNPKPVGKNLSFPTAAEAAYPLLLCKRIMAILLKYAIQRGAQNPVTLPTQLPQSATTSHRWILDMLPRGKKLKPLFSEFQTYVNFLNSVNCDPEESCNFS